MQARQVHRIFRREKHPAAVSDSGLVASSVHTQTNACYDPHQCCEPFTEDIVVSEPGDMFRGGRFSKVTPNREVTLQRADKELHTLLDAEGIKVSKPSKLKKAGIISNQAAAEVLMTTAEHRPAPKQFRFTRLWRSKPKESDAGSATTPSASHAGTHSSQHPHHHSDQYVDHDSLKSIPRFLSSVTYPHLTDASLLAYNQFADTESDLPRLRLQNNGDASNESAEAFADPSILRPSERDKRDDHGTGLSIFSGFKRSDHGRSKIRRGVSNASLQSKESSGPSPASMGVGIFGVALEETIRSTGVTLGDGVVIPAGIWRIWLEIQRRALNVEGIFRINGGDREISEIADVIDSLPTKASFDRAPAGEALSYTNSIKALHLSNVNPFTLSSLIKKYMRELPVAVLGDGFRDLFIEILEESQSANDRKLYGIILLGNLLPKPHLDFLIFILREVCSQILKCTDRNRMTIQSLAITLTPALVQSHHGLQNPTPVQSKKGSAELQKWTLEQVRQGQRYQHMVEYLIAHREDLVASWLDKRRQESHQRHHRAKSPEGIAFDNGICEFVTTSDFLQKPLKRKGRPADENGVRFKKTMQDAGDNVGLLADIMVDLEIDQAESLASQDIVQNMQEIGIRGRKRVRRENALGGVRGDDIPTLAPPCSRRRPMKAPTGNRRPWTPPAAMFEARASIYFDTTETLQRESRPEEVYFGSIPSDNHPLPQHQPSFSYAQETDPLSNARFHIGSFEPNPQPLNRAPNHVSSTYTTSDSTFSRHPSVQRLNTIRGNVKKTVDVWQRTQVSAHVEPTQSDRHRDKSTLQMLQQRAIVTHNRAQFAKDSESWASLRTPKAEQDKRDDVWDCNHAFTFRAPAKPLSPSNQASPFGIHIFQKGANLASDEREGNPKQPAKSQISPLNTLSKLSLSFQTPQPATLSSPSGSESESDEDWKDAVEDPALSPRKRKDAIVGAINPLAFAS